LTNSNVQKELLVICLLYFPEAVKLCIILENFPYDQDCPSLSNNFKRRFNWARLEFGLGFLIPTVGAY